MIRKKRKRGERKWLRTQLKGFDEKHIEDIKKKIPNIEQRIKTEFGKISRYNREYKKSVKMIEHYTELKDKYFERIKNEEKRYIGMVKHLNPKVTLKSPTKSYPYWRGKVWWGVGKFKKSGWEEFHIVSDKKVKKLNLSIYDIRQLGKEKFVDTLIKKDLLFYDNNRKIP